MTAFSNVLGIISHACATRNRDRATFRPLLSLSSRAHDPTFQASVKFRLHACSHVPWFLSQSQPFPHV